MTEEVLSPVTDIVDNDEAMDIRPVITCVKNANHDGSTTLSFSIHDQANLHNPLDEFRTTINADWQNIQLHFNHFDEYATHDNTAKLSAFIGSLNISEYNEDKLIAICKNEFLKGNAIVFGTIDFVDFNNGQANNKLGVCYAPVFYTVKPANDTNELLPIELVNSYIQSTYTKALVESFSSLSNTLSVNTSATPNNPKIAEFKRFIKSKLGIAAALLLAIPVVAAAAYGVLKDKEPKTEVKTLSQTKTPAEALKSVGENPVMLVNDQGTVETKNVKDMANIQVATTEEYLKKMGVDVNKKSDLSCLE